MDDFEWIQKPTSEELDALNRYKDDGWIEMNQELRTGGLSPRFQKLASLLDAVILKGRSTCPLTLYRAVSAKHVPGVVGEAFSDQAFLSATITEEAAREFYPQELPAKLVVEFPIGTPMAKFEHDSAGGEERERLLPRGTRLEVVALERITDLRRILREQCTTGRPWLTEGIIMLKANCTGKVPVAVEPPTRHS